MIGNMKGLLEQAQKLQQDMAKLQEEAAEREVTASSGGGMVRVTMNGKQELVKLEIDPEVVNPNDVAMLQDLIRAAVNEASRQSKTVLKEELSKLTGGLPFPIPGFGG